MGINIRGKEYKLSQYADDTSCFVRDTDSVVKRFENFQNEMFKGCVDCPVLTVSFSRSRLKASFQYFGMALHNPMWRIKFVYV